MPKEIVKCGSKEIREFLIFLYHDNKYFDDEDLREVIPKNKTIYK